MCFSMHLSNKLIICMDCPCAYSFNCKNLKRMNEERWNLESLNEDLVFFVLIAFGMDIPNRKEESSYAYIQVKDPSDTQGVGLKALLLLHLMFSTGEAPCVGDIPQIPPSLKPLTLGMPPPLGFQVQGKVPEWGHSQIRGLE